MTRRVWKQKTKVARTRIALKQYEISPVPIVGDGAIATRGLLSGHLMPVLILDTSDRPDVAELIRLQRHLPPGDVVSTWGGRSRRASSVLLLLEFARPSELKILLEFDIAKQGLLVDSVLHVRAVGLQSGTVGDRLATTMNNGHMIVEVVATGLEPKWNEIWSRELRRNFRRQGLTKRQADHAANQLIVELRDLREFRLRR